MIDNPDLPVVSTELQTASPDPGVSLLVAATFVAEPLEAPLAWLFEQLRLPVVVRFAPYNQVFQQLLSPTSELSRNLGTTILLVRLQDFIRDRTDDTRGSIEKIAGELVAALEQFSASHRGTIILAVLPPTPDIAPEAEAELTSAAAKVEQLAGVIKGLQVLKREDIDTVSGANRYDPIRDQLAHVPFSDEHFASLALAIARRVHANGVSMAKVLVLDCDNTLWQGVVGEDGPTGIVITPECAALQEFAVMQHDRGVLVCLASKNVESDVLQVFADRKDMRLAIDQIVAHRINWNSKAVNLRSLASELNLGLDSFVFIDDNPLECAEMQAELPQVITLQLPPGPAVEGFLRNLWILDKLGATNEDIARTRMYRENAARKAMQTSTADIGQFIASLALQIDISPPVTDEWPRIAQLTQRTNQFNFTTRRRSVAELQSKLTEGAEVLRVRVADRFGDYGLVGVLIAQRDGDSLLMDTFLLSCRVLGRGVEHTMLRELGKRAGALGVEFVALPYVKTDRNVPARAFADSVAGDLAEPTADGLLTRIPAERAASVEHRPGHDPVEVMQALASEEKKSAAPSTPNAAGRSEIYARFAGTLVSGAAVIEAMSQRGRTTRFLSGAAAPPATPTEVSVLQLMSDVLQVDGIGIDDDYFSLGGTSLLSVKLFADIERHFGQQIRLTAILEAPTVRKLAAMIDSSATDRRSGIVLLRPGGDRNVFLIHDGLGETLLYLHLARRLPRTFSVYGVEPRRLPGIPLAHASMEDMAADYLAQIRKVQPHGPYLLGGMCAGGVIAYEIAVQLTRAGETLQAVVVMDGATPQAPKQMALAARRRLANLQSSLGGSEGTRRSWTGIAWKMLGKVRNVIAYEAGRSVERVSLRRRFRLLDRLVRSRIPWPGDVPPLTVMQIYNYLESRYQPALLPDTPVILVRATAGEGTDTPYRDLYRHEDFGWRSVAQHVAIVDVTGGHSSMLQEHAVDSMVGGILRHLDDSAPTRARG
jgi:FkbH-like protein